MNLNHAQAWRAAATGRRPHGHAHFWERAALTRRQFLKAGATVAVAAFGAGLWKPTRALAAKPAAGLPKAIPGGTTIDGLGLFHLYLPTDNPFSTNTIKSGRGDPSTISDFNGKVAVAEMINGTGLGTGPGLGAGVTQFWECDVRFMDGEYIDVTGAHRQGTFAFI
jgi:hypothetical protein